MRLGPGHCQPTALACNGESLTAPRPVSQCRCQGGLELPVNKKGPPVSLLSRIFARRDEGRDALRPLWHRTVEVAREPQWFAECGIADTVSGRFDAITLVLSLVLLRMEREERLIGPSVRLTELFVDDMDGQLREAGIGDLVVGKKVGRLMSVLGGRLGAIRDALSQENGPQGEAALAEVVSRNVILAEGGIPEKVAARMIALAARIDGLSGEQLLAGDIPKP